MFYSIKITQIYLVSIQKATTFAAALREKPLMKTDKQGIKK
jgi:hypothetical protein